jgi:hypothetical protein
MRLPTNKSIGIGAALLRTPATPPRHAGPHRAVRLVLVLLKLSFGILISQRFLSRTGDSSIVDYTPLTHTHDGRTKPMQRSGDKRFLDDNGLYRLPLVDGSRSASVVVNNRNSESK